MFDEWMLILWQESVYECKLIGTMPNKKFCFFCRYRFYYLILQSFTRTLDLLALNRVKKNYNFKSKL